MYAYEYIKAANPMQAVDIYTEQCAIAVNAKDLAVMAARSRTAAGIPSLASR
jgi:glutaminase